MQSLLLTLRHDEGATGLRLLAAEVDQQATKWQRDLLLAPRLCAKQMQVSYLPLLPIKGRLIGQYRVDLHWQHGAEQVSVDELAALARRMGRGLAFDQAVIGELLSIMHDQAAAKNDISLAIPIKVESLEDERLLAWLRTELGRQRVRAGKLVLWISARGLRGAPALAQRLLRPAAEMGVKLAIGPLSDDETDLDLAKLNEVTVLVHRCQPEHTAPPAGLTRVAADYGKTLVVEGVDELRSLSELFLQPVHYLTGSAVSPPLESPQFEFPQD